MRLTDKYNNILIDADNFDKHYEKILKKYDKHVFEQMYYSYKQLVRDCGTVCKETKDSKKIDKMVDITTSSFVAMQDVMSIYNKELESVYEQYPLY